MDKNNKAVSFHQKNSLECYVSPFFMITKRCVMPEIANKLTLLHSEWPKLYVNLIALRKAKIHRVLDILSAIG